VQAEVVHRRILEQHPDHAGALHLLGVLAHQRRDDDRAAGLIARAIALLLPTRTSKSSPCFLNMVQT
jgi:hypothetical protein